MLDIKFIKENPEYVKARLLTRNKDFSAEIDRLLELDVERRALIADTEAKKAELDKSFAAAAAALLKEGIEVGYSADVKSGFKVGEKNGGYYISFSDESFEALLGGYLREKVAGLIFKA